MNSSIGIALLSLVSTLIILVTMLHTRGVL